MAKQKKRGYATRYNSRYGKTVRERVERVEKHYKGRQTCPYCQYKKVKRISAGIWYCEKCKTKFASKAYKIEKFPTIKEVTE